MIRFSHHEEGGESNQNLNVKASRSRRGLVIVVTEPPSPQFTADATVEDAHAEGDRKGATVLPSAVDCTTAALVFIKLNTCTVGSSTYLSRNLNVRFMLRSSWLSRGVRTCPGATRLIVSRPCKPLSPDPPRIQP